MRTGDGRRGPWDRRTAPAGIVVAVVAGLLVWLLATGGASHHVASPRPAPASSVARHLAPAQPKTLEHTASSGPGCHVAAGSQAVPQYAPQGITWQLYQTVALPYSKTAGPMVLDGGVARCYAHDPLGALLAASQISARYLIAPDWKQVLQSQVMPGKGKEAYAKLRAQYGNTGGDQAGSYNQLAGFKFVTYSPAIAVIEMASKNGQGALQAGPVTVVWSGGDWKLQLQPDGSSSPQQLPISSLVGFAAWGGV